MLEINSYPRTHALDQLYKQISPFRRQRIKELFDSFFYPALYEQIQRDKGQPVNRAEIGIEKILRGLNTAFEGWRYSFEDTDDATNYGDQALCAAVLHTILEIKPEWETIPESLEALRIHTTYPTH